MIKISNYSNIHQLISQIKNQLSSVYPNTILQDEYAWWIIEAITQKNKAELLAIESITLSHNQNSTLQDWLHKIVHDRMPLQYLLGSVPFNDLEILVEPPILIPRPETEEWTSNLIEKLQKLTHKNISILDLCSGSGCIAFALAKALPHAQVVAADISVQAIELGKKNAQHNAISNVKFLQSNLFEQLQNQKFDIIVSNPPYIAPHEYANLDPSVINWEDKQALVAEDDGLAIIKKIVARARAYLKNNEELADLKIPRLVLEIDYNQGSAVAQLMKDADFIEVTLHKDLEKKDRVVTGR